jgi:hypothetical protein
MLAEERWSDRTRARIFTQLEILGHMVAMAEEWEPRDAAARAFSERMGQEMVDALSEAEGFDDRQAEGVPDLQKLEEALAAAQAMRRDQPEGWDVRIVGLIRDDGSLVVTTGPVTSLSRQRA